MQLMIAGGFVFLFAVPALTLGQSSPLNVPPPSPTKSAAAPQQPDLLEGLTRTNEQKAKIDQIREDGKSHLAAVANDQKLSPEIKNAMIQGYHRIENGRSEMLTPEQQRDVRRRMHASKAAAQ